MVESSSEEDDILRMVSQPMSLVLLAIVACFLIAGTFTLLILGKPVPEPVWVAWGVAFTALFGHGTFLAQIASHQATVSDLMEAVHTGATAATPTPTNGGTTVTATQGKLA